MATSLPMPRWPGDADVAVCLTFDVDAEAPYLAESEAYGSRLSTLSEGRFGIVRALPRLLALLDNHDVAATFYVPGATAERHPDAIQALARSRHEIGHHGHRHLRSHLISFDEQRAEIDDGLTALADVAGVRPRGYRSPAWELTPATLGLLIERGFAYDSSAMGDDRPYMEEHDGSQILELPVHWSLDDWPYFGWSVDRGGTIFNASVWHETWLGEFESALADRRVLTLTMHPEVIGRGYRARALDRLLAAMRERAQVWFATHGQLAALMTETEDPPIGR
jgi:peptidoglycan/xylan/chitin deacetylase (PgdA/CDA1 family)